VTKRSSGKMLAVATPHVVRHGVAGAHVINSAREIGLPSCSGRRQIVDSLDARQRRICDKSRRNILSASNRSQEAAMAQLEIRGPTVRSINRQFKKWWREVVVFNVKVHPIKRAPLQMQVAYWRRKVQDRYSMCAPSGLG
jgi:hypothetical protein